MASTLSWWRELPVTVAAMTTATMMTITKTIDAQILYYALSQIITSHAAAVAAAATKCSSVVMRRWQHQPRNVRIDKNKWRFFVVFLWLDCTKNFYCYSILLWAKSLSYDENYERHGYIFFLFGVWLNADTYIHFRCRSSPMPRCLCHGWAEIIGKGHILSSTQEPHRPMNFMTTFCARNNYRRKLKLP